MKRILVCLALALGAPHLPANATGPAALPCAPLDLAQPLTLELAAEQAVCTNPQTLAAAARIGQAEGRQAQAQAAYNPLVDLSVGLEDTTRASTARAGVGVSWVLFDFGARNARLVSSRLARHAAELERDEAIQSVLMGTAERFFDLARAQGELEASDEAVRAAQASLEATQSRYELGVVPRVDVLQAQSRRSQVVLAQTRVAANVAVARARLAQFIGAPAQAPVSIADTVRPTDASPVALELLMEDLARHPQVAAARERERAATYDWHAARLRNMPTVSVGLNATHATGADNPHLVAGVTFVMPLSDGGMTRALTQQAEGALSEARAAQEATRQAVELAIVAAHAELEAARQATEASSDWTLAAAATLEQAEGRYRAGAGLLTDWLDAQAQAQAAREAHASALYTWQQARLQLARALGQLQLAGMAPGTAANSKDF